jgi:DNA-binding transcriptional ArsR family regulator
MDEIVKLFKALSDPTRVQIITHLATGDLCVGALAHRIGVTHSAVSQHLRILREARLVDSAKRGYWVHYSLKRERANAASMQVSAWLSGLCSQPDKAQGTDTGCTKRNRSRSTKSKVRR